MESLLRHALDSLIVSEENMQILEVLVINDGSKDSSLAIAQEYESKYPNTIKAIDKPNGNYGSCINKGMELATGKYVKVLDADDSFDTGSFDSFISFLSGEDADLVLSDFDIVNENDQIESDFTFDLPTERSFALRDIPVPMMEWLWHHSITYKTSVVKSFDYHQTEGISYTDDEWILEPMMNVKSILYFPHSVYMYLRGREGQTFDPKVIKKTLKQRVQVAISMVDFYACYKDRLSDDAIYFIKNKLVARLRTLYNYHLINYASSENMDQIIEFDNYLKNKAFDIYDQINTLKNNYGWHYIRQWRSMNYSKYAPALYLVKMKRNLDARFKRQDVKIEVLPQSLRRK